VNILIIEDDAELAAAIADYLALQDAECDFAYNGTTGLAMASDGGFDVIILDLMLPRMSGFDVCQQLRQQSVETPILMLTARDSDTEQLDGFQSGVDDYVIKPCSMPLLWARLQALLRRTSSQHSQLSIGPLTVYFKQHRVFRQKQELKLTPIGWKILELLARRSPEVVSRVELEDYAWPDSDVDSGNFNVQLHQLRRAVDKPFAYPLIYTIVGVGICLRDPVSTNE
jgi:DNA-binding response OmpR family regulator